MAHFEEWIPLDSKRILHTLSDTVKNKSDGEKYQIVTNLCMGTSYLYETYATELSSNHKERMGLSFSEEEAMKRHNDCLAYLAK